MSGNTPANTAPYGVWVEPKFLQALANQHMPSLICANPVKFSAPGPIRDKFWISRSKATALFGDTCEFSCGADNVDLDVYRGPGACRELVEHFSEKEGESHKVVLVCPPPQAVTAIADAMVDFQEKMEATHWEGHMVNSVHFPAYSFTALRDNQRPTAGLWQAGRISASA